MFHSAALKLTLWYLAIIMIISISFSTAIYHTSSSELSNSAHRQANYLEKQLTPYDFRDFASSWPSQLDDERHKLVNKLMLFNLMVLLIGGFGSYQLARRTLRPIEDSLDAQTRFTADASNELRTPLAAMQTENEVALRNPSLTKKEAVDILKSNLEEVAKLKALSEGLLRLASTNGKLQLQAVALEPVITQAIERWQKIADAKNIKIKTNLMDMDVRGDHQSLTELISILLDNAIKYSPPKTEITIKTFRKDKKAFIEIKDRGYGIKASDLPHIFDRFYRADPSRAKDQPGGYGLGLAIAIKLADLHGGVIEVKSAPDKGSTFTLQLPLA